jgi:serine/threonine protein kinase
MSYSDYRLLGLVGQGNFSRVFCAIDRRNCQLVALKEVLRQRFATKQFLRELNFLLSLRHPHIVSCHSIEYHPTARYLVTDYCEGGSLRNLLESGRQIALVEVLQPILDILSGLDYIHEHQVVHGDIKPENILLQPNPQGWIAKISDFGIAKFEREIARGMGLGGTGSPAYMAPECFYGKSTQASDLYAVGVILFELLLGNRPFAGTVRELTLAHMTQPPPIPTQIPFLLRSILNKALEKLPCNRFTSAKEMRESLSLAMVTLAKDNTKIIPAIQHYRFSVDRCNLRSLSIIDREFTGEAVIAIVASKTGIYLGKKQEIEYRGDRFSWRLTLPDDLVELKPCGDGCMTIVRSTDSQTTTYRCYYFPADLSHPNLDSLPCFSFSGDRLQIATAAGVNWFIVSHDRDGEKASVQIWCLQKRVPIYSRQQDFLPVASTILDNRHGSIVYLHPANNEIDRSVEGLLPQRENSCEFSPEDDRSKHHLSLCNRRGNWPINNFNLPIKIESLISHPSNPNSILAIENQRQGTGAIIKLKPYQIKRILLDFVPSFAIAISSGFCLANDRGKFALFDLEGNLLAEKSYKELGKIIAVAAAGEDRLLISTCIEDLYYFITVEFTQSN